jgi:hypothetical protein
MALLCFTTAGIVDSSFNPFIYFRFWEIYEVKILNKKISQYSLRIVNITTIVLFALFIHGVMITHLLLPDREYSSSERRKEGRKEADYFFWHKTGKHPEFQLITGCWEMVAWPVSLKR